MATINASDVQRWFTRCINMSVVTWISIYNSNQMYKNKIILTKKIFMNDWTMEVCIIHIAQKNCKQFFFLHYMVAHSTLSECKDKRFDCSQLLHDEGGDSVITRPFASMERACGIADERRLAYRVQQLTRFSTVICYIPLIAPIWFVTCVYFYCRYVCPYVYKLPTLDFHIFLDCVGTRGSLLYNNSQRLLPPGFSCGRVVIF